MSVKMSFSISITSSPKSGSIISLRHSFKRNNILSRLINRPNNVQTRHMQNISCNNVEEIHSMTYKLLTLHNWKCYLMTMFWCPSVILITSKHLDKEMISVMVEENEMFISHDVMSLFTNTPIDLALQVIRERLEGDTELHTRTCLTVENIMDLLKFIVTTTYSQDHR